MLGRLLMLPLLALIVSALAAPAAFAQEDGVTVDPDSPSAKEYAIPIEKARKDSRSKAGGSRPEGNGGEGTPLFGEGVGSDSATGTGAGSTSAGSTASNATTRRKARRKARRERRARVKPTPSATPSAAAPERTDETDRIISASVDGPNDGSGSTLPYVIGGLLVLMAGAGAGVALKRRSSAT